MTITPRQRLARWGESLAGNYLAQKGYTIIARNARTPHGEIDLVTRLDMSTIFVEVKTRSSSAFGLPEEAVTPQKQAHLLASAQYFLQTHPDLDGDWRVDVIAIQKYHHQEPIITHFENIIR